MPLTRTLVVMLAMGQASSSTAVLDNTAILSDLLTDLGQVMESSLVHCALGCANYDENATCITIDLGESDRVCKLHGIRQNLTLEDVGQLDLSLASKKYMLRERERGDLSAYFYGWGALKTRQRQIRVLLWFFWIHVLATA